MVTYRTMAVAGVMAVAAVTAAAQEHPGAKVFATQKCSICHSVAGVGNKKLPLDGVGAKLSDAQIREWIVNAPEAAKTANSTAKPVMKSYKLAPADLDALVGYMKSLDKK
jgi:mono/diheme cytochrome c family protein